MYLPSWFAIFYLQSPLGNDFLGVVLLAAGADIDAVTLHSEPVLFLACQTGPPQLVFQIIEAGADVNGSSGTETLLTAVARTGCEECARLLFARGADRSPLGSFGLTALKWAESQSFDRVTAIF